MLYQKIFKMCIRDRAYAVCPAEGLESPTIVGAQVANELLNITGIKASFVFTRIKDTIYVSARSMEGVDGINVQLVMERIGGGGHSTIAGAQLLDMTEGCLLYTSNIRDAGNQRYRAAA